MAKQHQLRHDLIKCLTQLEQARDINAHAGRPDPWQSLSSHGPYGGIGVALSQAERFRQVEVEVDEAARTRNIYTRGSEQLQVWVKGSWYEYIASTSRLCRGLKCPTNPMNKDFAR